MGKIPEKYKKLIREITIAVLSAILGWLGAGCTNILAVSTKNSNSNQTIENKTSGEAKADSTSINLFNKKTK